MPEHLTQRTLARLEPEGTGKRYFVYGSNPVGLGIEVSAKGKASYFVEIRIRGRRSATRKKIGSVDLISLSDAQAEAKAMLGDAAKGIDFRYSAQEEEIKPETVGFALEQLMSDPELAEKASTPEGYKEAKKVVRDTHETVERKGLLYALAPLK
ncbi:Arm DNA-binding domain-containing protein [Planktomarina temperata]|nr:Arm DNA-binding domain-containing protein [Planktomarina temperata]